MIRSADGTGIAVESTGTGIRTIVFVHGLAQSRQIWREVLDGPLARDHRLVAYDMRGHGDSEEPPAARAAGEHLGADLEAVIASLGDARPLVVGWSYGGVAIGEYLRRGGTRISGILLSAAAMQMGRAAKDLFGPTMMNNARALMTEEGAAYEAVGRAFLDGCAAKAIAPSIVERSVAEMLRVSRPVRKALLAREADYRPELAAAAVPIATLHGTVDSVVLPSMSEHVPNAHHTRLEGIGHLPWLEAPSAFEAALRELAARAV